MGHVTRPGDVPIVRLGFHQARRRTERTPELRRVVDDRRTSGWSRTQLHPRVGKQVSAGRGPPGSMIAGHGMRANKAALQAKISRFIDDAGFGAAYIGEETA